MEEKVGMKLNVNSGATLFDFKEFLLECCVCQQGSRFIQSRLELRDESEQGIRERQLLFDEVLS